jgi:hypothetical protein
MSTNGGNWFDFHMSRSLKLQLLHLGNLDHKKASMGQHRNHQSICHRSQIEVFSEAIRGGLGHF